MANKCIDNKLHNYSGTSQAQRMLAALAADYAKVDERSTADLLLFAKKYGTYLNFYGANNFVAGDWSNFMSTDISVTIASVQVWNTVDYVPYINTLYDRIKMPAAPYGDAQTTFKYIFDFVFSLATNLNNALQQLPADAAYATFLNTAIASKLAVPVQQLGAYYICFLHTVLDGVDIETPDSSAPLADIISTPPKAVFFKQVFSFMDNSPWVSSSIAPASMLADDELNDIITNNFFTGAVNSFLNGIINIVNQTAAYLDKTLSDYPTHSPHYALYLSFLRLFRLAQDHLNTYTERHLDFYYKKVLQLNNNPGLADTVHLSFLLQKNIGQHLLKQGTQFKAGKDANNNDLYYALTNDIVVNAASVQALKSLYLIKNYNTVPQQLLASTIANSADGQAGKITSSDQSWYPFGDLNNKTFVAAGTSNLIGFTIASNILYLNEGLRQITIKFNCEQIDISKIPDLGSAFSAKFTGNKNWFDASDYLIGNNIVSSVTQTQLAITISLSSAAPPIIPYSQKIHKGNFFEALPMVQLMVADYKSYAAIKSLVVTSIAIDVTDISVKNLSLQNDDGKIDSTKPFKLFGEFPEQQASFIVGSKEIFQKRLTALTFNFAWQLASVALTDVNTHTALVTKETAIAHNFLATAKANLNIVDKLVEIKSPLETFAVAPPPASTINYLSAGNWVSLDEQAYTIKSIMGQPNNQIQLTNSNLLPGKNIATAPVDFTANEAYTINAQDGFLRILLNDNSFNLPTYLYNVQKSLASVSVDITPGNPTTYTMKPPATIPVPNPPAALAFNIVYSASEIITLNAVDDNNFAKRTGFFYHIEPFGFREMHPNLTNDAISLLPVFNLDNRLQSALDKGQPSAPDNGGELWIGLSNAIPGETQSILFQVSEGSANPLKSVNKDLSWFYLSSNNWKAFDATDVVDQTNYLSQSGLIIFNLQGDETIDNTRADNNLLWIKAVVPHDTDSICKLITVTANAAKAQFVTDVTNKIYFTKNVAASIISKPAIADAALKQTSQPYASFGGSPKESNLQFNQRISERLRHKNRAVSSWDYERLVLQKFPQVHKVKCLNHTSIHSKADVKNYSELKPGDVMIVTVPDLSLVTGANSLLPFTSIGLLAEIKNYIRPLCSPFVKLHVCNPQFEAIQLDFNVYFINNNSNSSYYQQLLDTDIQQFLMPWAFGSDTMDIEFSGRIEKSVVLAFVQNRPYVDFVTCFKMNQFVFGEDGVFSLLNTNVEEAIATTARSILVPYKDPLTGIANNINPSANCSCNA